MNWREQLNHTEKADLAKAEADAATALVAGAEAYGRVRKIRQRCMQRARRAVA